MKQKYVLVLFCSLILWGGAAYHVTTAEANEGAGGQVTTNGKISFYNDSDEKPTESTEPSNVSSSEAKILPSTFPSKPLGKYFPSTGELVKNYGFIGIGCLLLLLLILFFRKRRKEREK